MKHFFHREREREKNNSLSATILVSCEGSIDWGVSNRSSSLKLFLYKMNPYFEKAPDNLEQDLLI